MTVGEYVFHSAFFALFFLVPALAAWASYSQRFGKFDISVLWTSHASGKVDTLLVIVIGTWWVHTCAVILWTLSKSVQTADFVTYMGWAVPIIASMFAPKKADG